MTRPNSWRKLVVFCIDGGVPSIVREHDLFAVDQWVQGFQPSPVSALPTVFPSSTAPAHASFLTGRHPDGHGIVGNSFWSTEPVAQIKALSGNPLSSVHPYERSTLTAPSLLDWCEENGLSAAAVQFPHTFTRGEEGTAIPSVYCLYAPSRSGTVPLEDGRGSAELTYFDHRVRLAFDTTDSLVVEVSVPAGHGAGPTSLMTGVTTRVDARLGDDGRLSIPLTVRAVGGPTTWHSRRGRPY
ncbi:alkaline phosphatase family protein [Streptomyces sp. NPDC014006]|uniref:alkaline phosphatase family protein n=1 Tax=Streptomyces sp. NPDC014006 TaxID=3364870 RepID=UPI0036F9ACCD